MSVKEDLEKLIGEVAGDDQELATLLREKIGGNDKAATRLVGGFLGRADVTRKQQEISEERTKFETLKTQYEEALTEAESEKQGIMKDLARRNISVAQAEQGIEEIKRVYGLKDEDLPFKMGDLIDTAKRGKVQDTTPDLEERLGSFETSIMAKLEKRVADQLVPQLSSLTDLDIIWSDIGEDHKELFGKRLTLAEKKEILTEARKGKGSLESVWKEKYGVEGKRTEIAKEAQKKAWRDEYEKEEADRRSKEALDGIRPDGAFQPGDGQNSPLFRKKFAEMPEPGKEERRAGEYVPARSDAHHQREGGAERAKQAWLDRRARGIPLGKEVEKKSA